VQLVEQEIQLAVQKALEEDVGTGDATTLAVIPDGAMAIAEMRAREELVLCGMDFVRITFEQVDEHLSIRLLRKDGDVLEAGDCLAQIEGSAAAILTAERTALNFIQRLSGVATLTRRYLDRIVGTKVKLLDTRKTTPGWRHFEKYGVACGGATNHRVGLYDMIMIKDNHLATLGSDPTKSIPEAIRRAKTMYPKLKVEVEADTLEQAFIAMDAGADIILLDNMSPDKLKQAVEANKGRCQLEASGGIHLETIQKVAESGVDFISVGAVTHSAPAVDIALDFQLPPFE
jgi:nicotinate-nucleotide pyrophosphorylase (carboxylating)